MAPVWASGVILLALLTVQATATGCNVKNEFTDRSVLECREFTVRLNFSNVSKQLEIHCIDNRPNFTLLQNLPRLPNFPFEELAYKDCPLPVGNRSLVEHLSTFLNRTRLAAINRLFFVDNAKLSELDPLDPELFAGLSKLKVLSMKNSTRMPLDDPSLFVHLPSLTWIDLRKGDGGSGVAKRLLRPLTQLVKLELMENELTTLPAELVSELPNLKTLTLYANKLNHIEPFVDLPALTDLDFKFNRLETLEEEVFDGLPNLSKVVLKWNRLSSLPSGLLRNNTKLTSFEADNQQGTGLELGDGLFAGLKMLRNVSLSGCKITKLPAGLFTDATNLVKINLSENELQSLPENLLRGLSSLKELYLQHNKLLDVLPDTLLSDAGQLRFLNLGHNQLTALSSNVLKNQINLEKLHLEFNQLNMIDWKAFASQRELRMLNLSHNQVALHDSISDITYREGVPYRMTETPFQYLNNVVVLDLSYNAIRKIFKDFTMFMGNLLYLNLSHNLIKDVSFENFPFLSPNFVELNLESNLIARPDYKLGSHKASYLPREILLANNPLKCDCESYPLIEYLHAQQDPRKSFPLKGLQCTQPPNLSGRKPLELLLGELICEIDNSTAFCPAGCQCTKRAVDLGAIVNCRMLNLTHVPAIAEPSIVGAKFIELHLERNMLHDLSNTGDGWNTVRELYVANNNLTTIAEARLPEQLEVLDVSDNRLTEIDQPFLTRMNHTALRNLRLSANPWECRCDNPLISFAIDNAALISDYTSLQCSDGQPISSTTLNELCSLTNLIVVCVVVAIVALFCLFCLAFYVKYSHEIKVWLFRHNWLQWLFAEEQLDTNKRYDAFISYAHQDENFVTKELLPRLESDELNFTICWHVRDFMPGDEIHTQIMQKVEESRRTIIVLSPHYLESVWGKMEFNTAYLQSVEDKRNRVIPIIYQDIGDVDKLDPELRAYLKTNTYVRADDPWFWDKLLYAMPHKRRPKGAQARDNMRIASTDKRILLKVPSTTAPPSIESTPPIERSAAEKGIANGDPLASYPDPAKPFKIAIISNGVTCN